MLPGSASMGDIILMTSTASEEGSDVLGSADMGNIVNMASSHPKRVPMSAARTQGVAASSWQARHWKKVAEQEARTRWATGENWLLFGKRVAVGKHRAIGGHIE